MEKSFVWRDLTVENADETRKFYETLFGWKTLEHDMGTYVDYDVIDPNTGNIIAGICNKKEGNQNIPSVWLNYMEVQSVMESTNICTNLGGKIIDGPRSMGQGAFAVLEDLNGTIFAIYSTMRK